jgi:uroporphyrinogen decarboxylase
MMHSCGNILPLLPDLIEAGLDGLNPLETKAGMDLVQIKRQYGERLVLQGGIDVRKMLDGAQIEEEIRTKFAVAKPGGGYVYHSDHSVPDNVSFADYCRVIALVKHYGKYC